MVTRGSPPGDRSQRAGHQGGSRARPVMGAVESFPIAAIGASAGGLDAFRTLLDGLPGKIGIAFLMVRHLDPTHARMTVELLARHTTMTIVEAGDGMRLEPDRVYMIPPGRDLALRAGAIALSRPRECRGIRMSFDFLLESLAAAAGARTICVVLSGIGTDGSAGAKAIKDASGLVIAQSPEEAEYDGMPRSAIATGAVDLVLPLAEMPQALAKFGRHRYFRADNGSAALPPDDAFGQILDLLRKRTSCDFTLYKEGTLLRRIERRMAMAGIEDRSRYLELLNRDQVEVQRLAEDVCINVTRFFRDTSAFDLLAERIVPALVRAHETERPIRVWVAGCSTGEEAYSIAILLLEAIAAAQRPVRLQIFASDVDEDAVAFAREGLYPLAIETDVPPMRLARHFEREDNGYRVSRELRQSIVFSVHNLLADVPFSRLDLITCRNLLIYLRPEAQRKVLSLFHFALLDGGTLFLGPAETVGGAKDHFEQISIKQRIYRHLGRSRLGDVELPLGHGEAARPLWLKPQRPPAAPRANIGEFAQRLLLKAYAPASVLINRGHQTLYYFGPTDLYLKIPTGTANLDLLASAREGLRPAIRTALDEVRQAQNEPIAVGGRVKRDNRFVAVTVRAQAVRNDGEGMVLVSFVEVSKLEQASVPVIESPTDISRLAQVEQELDAMRRELRDAIRDRETAEEKIRAVNEAAMSVHEEFQTANEELETAKEELQSLNEELTVLNSQLQETLNRSQTVADDLENILNSTDVAALFLDRCLQIRFFTPAARTLFSVIAADIGRPLADLAHHFMNGDLLSDAGTVLATRVPLEREIVTQDGRWYTCRVLPYRTKDSRVEGVVITCVDITTRKKAEDALNDARHQAASANCGKSRLLAAASHDLRQPLQTVTLLQGLLAKRLSDKGQLELVTRSAEALTAMDGMLGALLDINQLETGAIRPEPVDFPIGDALDRLRSEFTGPAQARGLDWRVLPSRLVVRSDPRLLEQMIRNLLSNAVKYTRKGGVLLGCRRRGNKLRIEIWDTGLGIPRSQLQMIFQEFHQVDNPARDQRRGLGLGLAIVQRLGDLLGHAVNVRSIQGRGSVFSIEVGLAPAAAPALPKGLGPKAKAVAERSGSLLIVEDDPDLRYSLENVLRADGHRVVACADGNEAIQLVRLKEVHPDLVIVDNNLPGEMTGVQIMARLHGMLGNDVPALVLSGDISAKTLKEIARHNYVHRSKPISAEDLTHLVRMLLAERRSTAS